MIFQTENEFYQTKPIQNVASFAWVFGLHSSMKIPFQLAIWIKIFIEKAN